MNPSDIGNIRIGIEFNGNNVIEFEQEFYIDINDNPTFRFNKVNSLQNATVTIGTKTLQIENYFYSETPSIWFANGDYLEGNNYYELKSILQPFTANEIETWDWTGVDLSAESQKYNPKITNSIQFKVIQQLKQLPYDIIFDDDGSGEIADVVTIKIEDDKINVELYHLKYAIDGVASRQIKNLYEVVDKHKSQLIGDLKKGKSF